MIVGLGTDIVEIARVESTLDRLGDSFAKRILTPLEFAEYQSSSRSVAYLAKRFCIKEAAAKALGTGIGRGISWQHMWVEHTEEGAPVLRMTGGALERLTELKGNRVQVSVSDEQAYATATVILEAAF
ncbi:holo-ACP synthase [Pseudomaricurvus alkylphenolicus]|jgi:holo-[acyl-carrier protein] synthase|uniref:holo-ACP synthase n=1 Tax=Pseudomaricurvus alkylphenolicus TaxID=1306991 RepID=UPI0014212C09|nr:holo-ACP synthase [Pseudomaricurvus alkylphenolicus]NIB43305.1 holo-ACP synthase [Pseudomaricurvus alkylphenolicus]